jgi:thioredoxin reductase (NADPH)
MALRSSNPAASEPLLDCIVLGAGAAGLTAATYLARFRRRIAVVDSASSRLLTVPVSHNYPGFTQGIHGPDVLARLREQALAYGVSVAIGTIERLHRQADGSFLAIAGSSRWRGRTVLLATGVVDVAPPFAQVRPALADGRLRYCPICDGYEAIGKKVAVLGRANSGLQEALFVRHFADEVLLCAIGEPLQPSRTERAQLESAQIRLVAPPVLDLHLADRPLDGMQLFLQDRSIVQVDVVYSALGTLVNSGVAQLLDARCTDNGELLVDRHQQTSVDGLYAAGDIVSGLNQITVAMGQAAIAATAIHNRLRQ